MPKLEITFPLYNDQALFARALLALSKQTFTDFHITAIDDASPKDFGAEIAARPELAITTLKNPTNLGAMANIWKSISLPTDSPYLLSHHADDFLKTDYLERAISILDSNPDVSFVVTGPEWVLSDKTYEAVAIGQTSYDLFDAADFAKSILNFAPHIFGSVIYRTAHRTNNWRYDDLHIFCDRHYLGDILLTNKSKGAFLHGRGIFERDHSADPVDKRGDGSVEENVLKLLQFYKELLELKYPPQITETIISNNTLYYYSNFAKRTPLLTFIKKTMKLGLLQPTRLRTLGLLSLISLPLSQQTKRRIVNLLKRK